MAVTRNFLIISKVKSGSEDDVLIRENLTMPESWGLHRRTEGLKSRGEQICFIPGYVAGWAG